MLNATDSLRSRSAGRCLAIAGMVQALKMVQNTAHGRSVDEGALTATLRSLFIFDADTVEAVYGDRDGVRLGLTTLLGQLGARGRGLDIELGRYLITLMVLERRLARRDDLRDTLRTGLEDLRIRAAHAGYGDPDVTAAIARLYAQTISTLQPRVMVHGDPVRLAEPATAHKIRALLLAALRSAVLWHQLGGTRLKLLFSRRRLIADARAWLLPAAT